MIKPMYSSSAVSCFNCGYSIAGLSTTSLCPECAFPIESSADKQRTMAGSIRSAPAAARLLFLLGTLQLGLTVWLAAAVAISLSGTSFKSDLASLGMSLAGLALWITATVASNFVAAGFTSRESQRSRSFLIVARVAVCFFASLSMISLLLEYATGFRIFLGFAFATLAVIAEAIAILPAAQFDHALILDFPQPLHSLRFLNGLVFLSCIVAVIAAIASLADPIFLSAVPFAPLFCSLRSFTLSHRIRTALGKV